MREDINYEIQKGCMKFGIIICIILIFITSGLVIAKCSKYNKDIEITVQSPIEEIHTIDSLVKDNKHKDSVLIKLDSIKKIMNDPECGNVIRIKGFINDQGWYEINATKEELNISPIENGQDVIILIGEHLSQEKIEHYL